MTDQLPYRLPLRKHRPSNIPSPIEAVDCYSAVVLNGFDYCGDPNAGAYLCRELVRQGRCPR